MAKKASKPASAPAASVESEPDLADLFYLVTPEKLKGWKARAEEWRRNPKAFAEDGLHQTFVQIQFLLDVGLNPEPSKVGLQTSLQALRDYRELYELALDALEEEKARGGGGGGKV